MVASLPPANFEVHNPDAVAPLAKPLKKMVALMGAPFDPVGLLEDQNSHASFHHAICALTNVRRCL